MSRAGYLLHRSPDHAVRSHCGRANLPSPQKKFSSESCQPSPRNFTSNSGHQSKEGDSFRISGTAGHIQVEAATLPTLLYGVNWYLKYVAHLQVSTNGMQLGHAGLVLPAPQRTDRKARPLQVALRPERERRRILRTLLGRSPLAPRDRRPGPLRHQRHPHRARRRPRPLPDLPRRRLQRHRHSPVDHPTRTPELATDGQHVLLHRAHLDGAAAQARRISKETDRDAARTRHHPRPAGLLRHRPRRLRNPPSRRTRHHPGRLERLHAPRLDRPPRPQLRNPRRILLPPSTRALRRLDHLRHGNLSGGRSSRRRPRRRGRKAHPDRPRKSPPRSHCG